MKPLILFVFIGAFTSCGRQFHFASLMDYAKDSSYIYRLPFEQGTSHLLVQGYNSMFSHRGRLALDFKMKKGTPIMAARKGVVSRVVQDYMKGGVGKRFAGKANLIVIRHEDGTQAYYGHIRYQGALVHIGDTIKQGQVIGYSGSTGFSAFPHLHFSVWQSSASGRKQLATRFLTNKGILYLKPGNWYKAADFN
ncbi:MAG TPA: M23 family metallopeptidase [Flavisolibacter sp.]|nr:M23 family metallopeptidase [Flavisolibacter sp.]